ncbi:glycosyltransferase family 39 protein [Geodermatophilus sp. SYSU D00710]
MLLLISLTGTGAVLRFAGIGDKSMWIDETFSVWVSGQPLGDLWRTTVDLDFHPPLYYAVLHAWLALGDGEVAVRSLSALLGVLTLPVVFLIGERLGGRVLGLVSTGLLAVSPLQIAYAQQARMYTLMTLCAAVSILFLVVLVDPRADAGRSWPGRLGPALTWGLFVVSTALAMSSHNTAVLLPLAITVAVGIELARSAPRGTGGHPDRPLRIGSLRDPLRGVVGVATGLGAAGVLWAPWLPYFVAQARRVDEEFWIEPPTLATFLQHWHDLVNAYGPEGASRDYVLAGVLVLVVLGVRQLRGGPGAGLLLLVLVPVAVELLVSLRRPIFFTQTLIWTSIPLSVLLAAGILRLRIRPLVSAVSVAIVLINAVGIRGYQQDDGKEAWRTAAQYVAEMVEPGELVLFSAAWAQIPFDYYYARFGGPPITQRGLPVDVLESEVIEMRMTGADLPRLDRLTSGRPAFWVVYSHDWYTDPEGIVPARLAATFQPAGSRSFTGVTVTRYRAAPE